MRRSAFLILPAALLLSGCLGDAMEVFCETSSDSDHCFQGAAVQEADPDGCEKVTGKDFAGSNPPRDKCFLQIASNTGDPSSCSRIEGGLMSYSEEECVEGALRGRDAEACIGSPEEAKCRTIYAQHGRGCGGGYVLKDGACALLPPPVPDAPGDDIESRAKADLGTLKDAATGKYMELLEADIESETDPARLAGLQKYKEFLDKASTGIEQAQAGADQLRELKRIFVDAYDPSMDIERMPVDKLLAPGLFDRVKSGLFGLDAPTERSKAEDALTVYAATLKRQEEIDFLKKGRLERLGDVITSKAKDDVSGRLKDQVTGAAEAVAGTAFATVGFVDQALSSFQEAAQQEMFIGLAAAYGRQREAIAKSNPDLPPAELHARAVASVKADPYQDAPNAGFVKYGNLLENTCEGNPLCIEDTVFWTAMDKAYAFAAQPKR